MYHPKLEIQIKNLLGKKSLTESNLKKLLKEVSQSYNKYDKEKADANKKLSSNDLAWELKNKKLLTEQENIIKAKTQKLIEIAQFPLENPNPIIRISIQGEIVFLNPEAKLIKTLEYAGKKYAISDFFLHIIHELKNKGTIDISANRIQYVFFYKKIKGKQYYNFYGADITEKNALQSHIQESYQQLQNILDNTDEAYYLLYSKNHEKSIVTSKWKDFFGFDLQDCNNILKEREKYIIKEGSKNYFTQVQNLAVDKKINITYQVKNKQIGKSFWLSENIYKYYDKKIDDIVISGKIANVTQVQLNLMQIKESEDRFRKLIDVTPVMIWVSNEENIVTYSNKALKKFLGKSLEDLENYKQYISFIHPRDKKIAFTEWKKKIDKKLIIESEFRLKNYKGEYRNVFEKAIPRFYEDGRFAGYIGVYFDRSEEKKYQEELIIDKEKLELLTRNSPDIILLTNENGIIEYASPTTKKILGYTDADILNKNLTTFICKECKHHLESISWLKKTNKPFSSYQFRMKSKKGDLIWVQSLISFIPNVQGAAYKILLHNRDIHELKQAENLLAESEQKYRGLFENMHLGVMEVDLNEKIKWVNKSFEEMTGYSFKFLKGKNASNLFLSNTVSVKKMQNVGAKRVKKNDTMYEIKMKKRDGRIADVVISGSPIIDLNGNVKGSIGIHWDVTEIRKTQKMLEQQKINTQNEVMKASINAEETQKQILGNELHDGVGHILTYTSLFLQMASQSEKFSPDLFNKAHENVEKAINEVRRISRNLVPPALMDLGLKDAIIELMNQFGGVKKIQFKFVCKDDEFKEIEFEAQRNIYRIIQELVNNSVKYALCDKIDLQIKHNNQKLFINYSDNGIGFDINKVKKGLGIKSINSRVYFYEGTTQIESVKNKGTVYYIEIPISSILKRKKVIRKNSTEKTSHDK